MNIYDKIKSAKETLFAILIDPDKASINHLKTIANYCKNGKIDFLLIGGSIVSNSTDDVIQSLKELTDVPVILFPGSPLQISYKADGILFLSLISGRNPELLIGHHVLVAKALKNSKLEVIPTGYILVGNDKKSATEYISNTTAIPTYKPDIAISTAIAGELLGMKAIYLEAGSGADNIINENLIFQLKKQLNIPLIVGGGIKNKQDFDKIKNAGADVIVVGTAIEENPDIIQDFF